METSKQVLLAFSGVSIVSFEQHPQAVFTCSKSTMKTSEQHAKVTIKTPERNQ